jgi:hypothetical protein
LGGAVLYYSMKMRDTISSRAAPHWSISPLKMNARAVSDKKKKRIGGSSILNF